MAHPDFQKWVCDLAQTKQRRGVLDPPTFQPGMSNFAPGWLFLGFEQL